MKKFIILLTLATTQVLFIKSSWAQDVSVSNVNWSSSLTMNSTTAQITNETTQFVTYSNDSIQWIGQDGTIKYRLKVNEVNGTWTDVSQPGSIIYEVDNSGKRGVVMIARGSDLKIRFTITTDTDPLTYELTINSLKTF